MLEIEGPHCQQCSPELIIAESEGYVKREYRGEYRISVGGERNNLPGDSDIVKPTKNGINKKLLPFGAHKHDGAARNAKIYIQKDCPPSPLSSWLRGRHGGESEQGNSRQEQQQAA